jgi:hypothetical protein
MRFLRSHFSGAEVIIGVISMLLLVGGCSITTDAVTSCKAQAESAIDPAVVKKVFEKPSASGSTLAPDLVEVAVQGFLEDPDIQKQEFMLCMIDAQAICFIDGAGLMSEEEIQMRLGERGWSNPTKWDCFWPKTKTVVENPFD